MFFTGLASDLQDVDKKTHRPTKLISQGKQVGYFYDKHGRVKTKTITPVDKDGVPLKQSSQSIVGYLESLQLFYTPNNELEKSIKIHQQGFDVITTTTHYYYDAFGRRIGKSSSTQKSSKLNQRGQLVRFPSNLSSLNTTDRPQRKNTLMLWDGNRQIQEYTDEQIFTTVYEQNSFEPVARVVQLSEVLEKQRINNAVTHVWQYVPSGIVTQDVLDNVENAKQPLVKIYYYHNNHLGTPQELTDSDGDVVWLSYDYSWGGQFDRHYKPQQVGNYDVSESELQPIKFQGQSLDTETGLHYNRFRYYDSDVGMFISRDPIGLLGGSNVFQYAPNPVMWIDPWGLSNLDSTGRPLNSPFYSVWYETAIPENLHSSGRPAHFRDANQQLYNHILANPELSKILPPEVVAHVHPGVRGGFSDRSPPNHTWHHNAYDPSRIELVPRGQHRAPGAAQQSLHPNQGGGFKQLQATKC